MMDVEDNLTRQVEEVEALSAIYGEDWIVLDEAARKYAVEVRDDQKPPQYTLKMQVTLPEDYPSKSPPHYNIEAPWLRGVDRKVLDNSLSDIYCENLGENIIFLWVVRVKEFLEEMVTGTHLKGNIQSEDLSYSPSEECCVGAEANIAAVDSETNDLKEHIDDLDLQEQSDINSYTYVQYKTKAENPAVPSLEIQHGEFVWDRKSKFQGHLAVVHKKEQVQMVLAKLKENRKIAAATHNIYAYRIRQGDSYSSDCEDDGEIHAGSRLLHLLDILDAENVMVVVTRWYGGIHLGPDRFKHISNCARNLLHENGYLREKEEKKGPKSGKKTR